MQTTIKTLFSKGYNKSDIANILGINRKTVRKILKETELKGFVERKERTSSIDEYKEYINIQTSKGLTAVRIHQDLIKEFDFQGGYDAIRKYVSKIKKKANAFMVMNSLPGEEAQVDFGEIGSIKYQGKRKRACVFVMTLSFSRHMYAEVVFNQSVKTFIQCHRNAFRFFGGVPSIVKVDNLKAAILNADFYEPTVQKHYAAFASHYDFLPEPCRVYTPTDKGKVESNVKYVKDNCFKGREFNSLEEAQSFLIEWLNTIANVRIHGTTKKVPSEIFKSTEKAKLKELPITEYTISASSKATVNTNCHISNNGNYYSVPYAYIGQEVNVIEINNILKIFYKEKEIASHPVWTGDKGHFITNKNHYPSSKNISSEDILSRQKTEMRAIGPYALMFLEKFIESDNYKKYDYRALSGILSLRKRYPNEIIENACHRAIEYGALSYKIVKKICEKGIVGLPVKYAETYVNSDCTHITRELSMYDKLAEMGASNE